MKGAAVFRGTFFISSTTGIINSIALFLQ